MRVLGITPSANDVSWALLEGTRTKPTIIPIGSTKQKFPTSKNQSAILHDLYHFALSFLREHALGKVVILQAGTSQFGNTSGIRVKVEAIFQIACTECNIPIDVIHPNTLKANIKKFQFEAGNSPENVFNGGNDFKSKALKDTVLTAWVGLDA